MLSGIKKLASISSLICGALFALSLSVANAEDNGKQSDDRWNIVLTPYLWGTSLDGQTAFGRVPPVDVDASFSDILSSLNIGGSLHTEFRKGKWNFVIDPTYMNLEMDTPTQDVTLPPPPLGGLDGAAAVVKL